ncbi:MAG: L,D-transpeptidase family protein [Rhodobacteraceae bacterium]|nr:L,D-transpeptidase family protein [Paracoccaceae bacterium]
MLTLTREAPAKFNPIKIASLVFVAGLMPLSAIAQAESNNSLALDTSAHALMVALEGTGEADLFAYYEQNSFAPIFSDQPARLTALLDAMGSALSHGLPVPGQAIEELQNAISLSGQPDTAALLEIVAARAYVDFSTMLTSGLLNPHDISPLINFDTLRPEIETLLAKASTSLGDGALYDMLEPQDPSYNALQVELASLEELVEAGDWGPKVPAGATLRGGENSPRVLAMRQRLISLGYVGIDGESPAYDDALVIAVMAFQSDNTLDADGIVGPKTLLALNLDPSIQMQQVIVNLERRRWLNRDLGGRHILVNQASFMGYVVDDNEPVLVTRVVVGMPGEKFQTPEFIDEMDHIVINPSWFVPRSIATEEYLPQLRRDPGALTRQNFVMTARGTGQRVDPRLLDMSQYSKGNFPFNLRQRPGSNNALGKVKFMFPNKYSIYLHDTPAKSLFNRDSRAYSHGCVRVQRPFDLAYTLLAPQEADPEATFQRHLNSGQETRVNLETPVPIYLTYQTVFLDEAGKITYRVDVYGRDTLVFDALAENGVTLPEIRS